MIGLFYDTETSDMIEFKLPSDDPRQPHIVQIGAFLVDLADYRVLGAADLIVRPDGWTISQETTEIHGITNEHAAKVGVPEDLAVDVLYAMAAAADVRIGFNEAFDARMTRIGLKRAGDLESAEAFKAQAAFCTMAACRKIIGGRNPNLAVAHATIVGYPMTGAHTAIGDAQATLDLYKALALRGAGYGAPAAEFVGAL